MIKHLPDFIIALIITMLMAAWIFEMLTSILIVVAILVVLLLIYVYIYSMICWIFNR